MINMLPTTSFQPPPQNAQFGPGEKPEKTDLYSDLFAAFFTVSPPNQRWVDPLKTAAQNDGEKGPKAGAETTVPEIARFEIPGSGEEMPLIPARQAPIDGPEFLGPPVEVSKFAKVESTQTPLGPHARIPIVVSDTCGLPADTAGGPRSGGGISMILPPEGDHMPIDILTLDNPGHPQGGGVGVILPPNGDHMPIDILTLDDFDHPQEDGLELLDIQQGLNPFRKSRGEVEPVLELKEHVVETPVSEGTPISVAIPTPVVKEPPARLPREFAATDKRELKVEADSGANKSPSTLLEAFTASVLVDSRPREMVRAATAGRTELTEFVEAISLAGGTSERLEAEPGADFSFESTVSSETAQVKAAPFEHAEEKLKEAILDQVGTTVSEFAESKMASPAKREITIRLKPEELGTVEVTLMKNADGVLSAHFTTDNPQTQHLLDQTLAQLRESLENSGMKVGLLETSCNSNFSDAHGSGSPSSESRMAETRVPLRTTFDDLPRTEETKTNRLVNLRA
jgi:hypothetical protein